MNVLQAHGDDCKIIVPHDQCIFLRGPGNKHITQGVLSQTKAQGPGLKLRSCACADFSRKQL